MKMDGIDGGLKKLLRSKKNKEKYYSAWLRLNWATVCGDEFAEKSIPREIKGDVLFIAVQNAVWAHALLMKKTDIIDKINEQIKDIVISDIKFATQKLQTKKNIAAEQKTVDEEWPALEEQDEQSIRERLKIVDDQKLKEKLYSILSLAKRKKQYDKKNSGDVCRLCGEP